MQELNLFAVFIEILNKNEFPYFISGSVASIVYGEPRLTHDIDFVINLSGDQVTKFINAFPLHQFYCPPEEVIRAEIKRSSRGHLNLIHHETGFKADIYFSGDEDLQHWALANRKSIEFSGMMIYLAPPEYVIVKKIEYFKEGKSQKHITDIEGILNNSQELIDFKLLQEKLSEAGVQEIWKEHFTSGR